MTDLIYVMNFPLIQSDTFRTGRYADGVYHNKQYFQCASGCGLFVSLDKLSPEYTPGGSHPEALDDSRSTPKLKESKPSYVNAASRSSQEKLKYETPSQSTRSKAKESSDDSVPFQYQVGDRVLFHNKQGKPHYGSVEWTGRKKGVPYNLVGIITVSIKLLNHSYTLKFNDRPNSLMLYTYHVFDYTYSNATVGIHIYIRPK